MDKEILIKPANVFCLLPINNLWVIDGCIGYDVIRARYISDYHEQERSQKDC